MKSKFYQPVINSQHRINEMCGPFPPMEKSLSHLKVGLMSSIDIKNQMENPTSRLVYEEGRATR